MKYIRQHWIACIALVLGIVLLVCVLVHIGDDTHNIRPEKNKSTGVAEQTDTLIENIVPHVSDQPGSVQASTTRDIDLPDAPPEPEEINDVLPPDYVADFIDPLEDNPETNQSELEPSDNLTPEDPDVF